MIGPASAPSAASRAHRARGAQLGVALALSLVLPACEADLSMRGDAGRARDAPAATLDVLAPDAGPSPLDAGVPTDASGGSDAGPPDATGGSDAGPPDVGPLGRVVYAEGRAHSPLTADVAEGLRALAARAAADEHVFSKVGDSITVSTSFLHCFAGSRVDLAGRTRLQASIDWFAAGDAGGTPPFTRTSLAATVGWSASAALAGAPSPLDAEIAAVSPRYASVMFGTNDAGFRTPFAYAANMLDITDRLLAAGAIPVLSTIPPRDDSASADANTWIFDLLVRGIAQGRGVPLVDLHAAMLPLPGHGLAGDGVHPSTSSAGACVFTAAALEEGYNVRNLLVIEALDRARRALAGEAAPDADAPRVRGAGTHADPYVEDSWPWTDLRSTAGSSEDRFDRYDACSTANEAGPEVVYRLAVPRAATLHAWLVDRGATDIDLQLLDASGMPTGCLARDNQELSVPVSAGTYFLVLDSWVDAGGVARAGEYLVAARLE